MFCTDPTSRKENVRVPVLSAEWWIVGCFGQPDDTSPLSWSGTLGNCHKCASSCCLCVFMWAFRLLTLKNTLWSKARYESDHSRDVLRCFWFWLRLTFHTRCRETQQPNPYRRWWCCWKENFVRIQNPERSAWMFCVLRESYRAGPDCSGSMFFHSFASRRNDDEQKWYFLFLAHHSRLFKMIVCRRILFQRIQNKLLVAIYGHQKGSVNVAEAMRSVSRRFILYNQTQTYL